MVQSQDEPPKSDDLDDHYTFDVRFECNSTMKSDIKSLGYDMEREYKDGDYEIYQITKDGEKVANVTFWLTNGKPSEALLEAPLKEK